MVAPLSIALLLLARVPPSVEITAVAAWHGVDPAVALAVAEAETGNVPERDRDRVVSRGNVGRFQIRATTWARPFGYPSRSAAIRGLQDRHTNIRSGVRIVRQFRDRYAGPTLTDCRCGSEHLGGWISHYKAGGTVEPKDEGYGLRIAAKVRRLRGGLDRRW